MTEHDPPDDPLDPALAERFAALDDITPPDTWPGGVRTSGLGPRRWVAAVAAVAVLTASVGWVLTRDDEGEATVGDTAHSTGSTVPPSTSVVPFVCPVTDPATADFTAPAPWPPDSLQPDTVWFGSDELWTVLDVDGYKPRKSIWWSANFPGGGVEPVPEIAVIYERLDEPGEVVDLGPDGTNANTALDGWLMLAGFDPATPGCWEATASYKGATLSHVFEVFTPTIDSPALAPCPDPAAAARHLAGFLPMYDYQGSASPAENAASADHVVVGTITAAGAEAGETWFELSELAPVGELGADPIRITHDFFAFGEFDPTLVVGVRALAMVYENPNSIDGSRRPSRVSGCRAPTTNQRSRPSSSRRATAGP